MRLVEFLPPWRFGSGIRRFVLQPDGSLHAVAPLGAERALQKAARHIDGLLLRPSWPGSRGLALIRRSETVRLHAVKGQQLDSTVAAIDIADPALRMRASERGLYRRFTFSAGAVELHFRDAAGRLVAPQRSAARIFPDDDFSPFARLIGMLDDPTQRDRLLADFGKHRFKYSRWVTKPDARSAARKRVLLS